MTNLGREENKDMRKSTNHVTRRKFLATGSVGTMAAISMPYQVDASQPALEEQENISVVNGFCATFLVPFDWDKMASFLTTDCKYRASQNIPLVEGPKAIVDFLKTFGDNATSAEFEILDTWARGPIVVNERIDRFTLPDTTFDIPVIGIFYLVDGKIAEWTDFVVESPTAT